MINKYIRLHFWHLAVINSIIFLFLTTGISSLIMGCGKKQPEQMESFHPNGNIWERWFEDSEGHKQGKAQTFYANGQLQTEAEFLDGYLHGEFVMWSKDGDELSRGIYKNGEPWSGTFVSVDNMQRHVVFKTYKEGKRVK